jgi:hypothetical protein
MRWIVLWVCACMALDASAQGMPRRDRGLSTRETRERPAAAPIVASDPFSALERELPSLEVDLLVRKEQLDAWRSFARDVRDVAEMDRAQRKHLMALREGGEKPPSASTVIAALSEDARLKSEAAADLRRHFDQLYESLDDAQRRTLDRRVVQSQAEPLGR